MSIIPGIEISTGPNGDEQRIERISEARGGRVLETANVLRDLDLERTEIPAGRRCKRGTRPS